MTKLNRDFYARDTLTVARQLLGKELVHITGGKRLVCRITETEAYIGRTDKACHAYGYRRTRRTQTMFEQPGTAYVYLIYGMYHCLNFVTERPGEPCAVLIRGGAAVENADTLARRRFGVSCKEMTPYQKRNFLNGPGKLCLALGLSRLHNGLDLTGNTLYVRDTGFRPDAIQEGPRIGIDYAEEAACFPWRFWV